LAPLGWGGGAWSNQTTGRGFNCLEHPKSVTKRGAGV
jgi:hypothetical protein